MLTKTKPPSNLRVKFSHECELIIFTPSAIGLDSDSVHTIETDDAALNADMDNLSMQTLPSTSASAVSTKYSRYRLGDNIQSHIDMAKITCLEELIHYIYSLQLFEFAWVKRNSGDWTFSELVERKWSDRGEEVMTFSVSETGHRKSVRQARWIIIVRACSTSVRPIYVDGLIVPIRASTTGSLQ